MKKFKVRVSYFGNGKYTVDYAHYKWIPNWRSLNFWFQQTVTGGTECWSTNLFSVEDAEKLANTLKCIEDVEKYYAPYIKERAEFYKAKADYYQKNVPYQSKEIL